MIKFNRHHVTDGTIKARVFYSLDNHVSGKPTVTIYAKDYSGDLGKLIRNGYRNETDLQSDYFDHGHCTLQEGHEHYEAARKAAETANEAKTLQRAKRDERRRNPKAADPSTVTIASDETRAYGNKQVRHFDVRSSGLQVIVAVGLDWNYCNVSVCNAMARVYRGTGKFFRNLEEAKKNYRDPKVLAALVAVERASRPRIHVKADCVEVAS